MAVTVAAAQHPLRHAAHAKADPDAGLDRREVAGHPIGDAVAERP